KAFTDLAMLAHDPGWGHPERAARLQAVRRGIEGLPIDVEAPAPASREALVRVHDAVYVDELEATAGRSVILDADTATSPGSLRAAHLAAGAAIAAVDS